MRSWTTADGVRHWADTGYQAALVPMAGHGKARPRVTVKGVYMPADYERARDVLRQAFGSVTLRLPVSVKVTTARRIPASWPKRKQAAAPWTPCTTKPDADNLAGWVLDSLFDEDSAVVWVECIKVWGPRDLVKVEIREVCADEPAIGPQEMAFE